MIFANRHIFEPIETGWPDVQAWCCDLDDPHVISYCDPSFLAADELQRAEKMRSERHRQLFLRRRALRRHLLGRHLVTPPRSLSFEEAEFGKPQFLQSSPLRCGFSTSCAENIFGIAMSPESEIGMDVEVLRPEWNMEFVAAMCLDEPQLRQLENFPPQEHQKQFLRFWTLREAFAKATGDGIAQPAADHISTASVWDCGFNASPPPPDWDWIQQWHRIGNHDVVISIARKIPADTATTSASSAVRRAD